MKPTEHELLKWPHSYGFDNCGMKKIDIIPDKPRKAKQLIDAGCNQNIDTTILHHCTSEKRICCNHEHFGGSKPPTPSKINFYGL